MQEFNKDFFQKMPREDFYIWIKENKQYLIGSAVFTRNSKLGSKVVSLAEKIHDKSKDTFIPSHTASIIQEDGDLYLFDMKPPRASIQSLTRYLLSTKDDYILVLRDFALDGYMFSLNLLDKVGDWYPYLSAIRSVFTKFPSKYAQHCSEVHLHELQKQGQFLNINKEITPNELLNLFRQPTYKDLERFIESEN